MSYISEKGAYLDGLADGLGVTEEDKQGKLLRGIMTRWAPSPKSWRSRASRWTTCPTAWTSCMRSLRK